LACDLDEEGKGWIDFENFIYFLNESVTGDEPEEELKKIFALFDDEKTGFISISGLRRISKLLNLPLEEVDME
jgi:Ca2+-binding EF-hand superfamily protein